MIFPYGIRNYEQNAPFVDRRGRYALLHYQFKAAEVKVIFKGTMCYVIRSAGSFFYIAGAC
jgi:hypothetical protein